MGANETKSRFKDAIWANEDNMSKNNFKYIVIGGAGGIGSWCSLFLARIGFIPYVYDFDTIENSNIGGQFFKINQIGTPKTSALYENIQSFSGRNINPKYEKYTSKNGYVSTIMISAFDNMEARKTMFERFKLNPSDKNCLFVDGRLSLETMQIFCVRNTQEDIEKYEKYLYTEEEVPADVCSMKQSTHTAAMIASHMVGFLTNHVTNVYEDNEDRIVPFKWEYFVPLDFKNKES